jgi:hypothetical protein
MTGTKELKKGVMEIFQYQWQQGLEDESWYN